MILLLTLNKWTLAVMGFIYYETLLTLIDEKQEWILNVPVKKKAYLQSNLRCYYNTFKSQTQVMHCSGVFITLLWTSKCSQESLQITIQS